MPRVLARRRPRRTSVDFSRLGWLLETEAAFQAVGYFLHPLGPEFWNTMRPYFLVRDLARLRHQARGYLYRKEVIV